MIRINEHFTKLKASYLFADIAKRALVYVNLRDNPRPITGIEEVTAILELAA